MESQLCMESTLPPCSNRGRTVRATGHRYSCLIHVIAVSFRISSSFAMSPFKTLFLYSAAMLFLPLFMYYFSKYIFDGYFGAKDNSSVFYAAMTAVVTVHVVLGLFLWTAFTESPPPPPPPPAGIKKD